VLPAAAAPAEYAQGSQVFLDKISSLQGTYGSMRRTRGDGNCFFRSFIYRYLEWLLVEQKEEECQQ
jgi:ubiquitin thioesterase protein OTUB1